MIKAGYCSRCGECCKFGPGDKPCEYLKKDGDVYSCSLERKPKICQDYPPDPYHILDGCTYYFTDERGNILTPDKLPHFKFKFEEWKSKILDEYTVPVIEICDIIKDKMIERGINSDNFDDLIDGVMNEIDLSGLSRFQYAFMVSYLIKFWIFKKEFLRWSLRRGW